MCGNFVELFTPRKTLPEVVVTTDVVITSVTTINCDGVTSIPAEEYEGRTDEDGEIAVC